MAKVIMTSAEWVERMEHCANQHPNAYNNHYPYNLLYFDGTTLSADCVNLQKALLNGYDISKSRVKGYYQRDLSNTGDVTEWGLLKQCSDISGDFTKLEEGFPRLLYKSGHIGAFLGKETIVNGRIVNVIEATVAFGGGIIYSYVDTAGRRYAFKGGAMNGAWTKHGLATPWVKYPKNSSKVEWIMMWQKAAKADGLYAGNIDGDFGSMSRQAAKDAYLVKGAKSCPNLINFWERWMHDKGLYNGYIGDGDFGYMLDSAVRTAQKAYGLYVDGWIGLKSTMAFLGVE